jgi:hypothetical protein
VIETGRNTERRTSAQLERSAQALPRARQAQLVVREVGDELLVYDLTDHQVHALNRAAALVWRYCDGQTTIAQARQLLEIELETPYDESAVHLALDQLHQANLLEATTNAPRALVSPSRRVLLRRLGAAAVGGAVLLPLVESISAPQAAQAQTACLQLDQTCSSAAQCCGAPATRGCDGQCCVLVGATGCADASQCCGITAERQCTGNPARCCVITGASGCSQPTDCCGSTASPPVPCTNSVCCIPALGACSGSGCCNGTCITNPNGPGQICCAIDGQPCNTSNQCCGEPIGLSACNNAKCCIKGGQPCPSNPALCCGGTCEGSPSVCKS